MKTVKRLVMTLVLVLCGCSKPSVEYVAVSGQIGAGSILTMTGNLGEMQVLTVAGSIERTIPLVDVDFNDSLQTVASNHVLLNATIKETKQKLSFAKVGGAIVCLSCGDLGLPISWKKKNPGK